VRVICDPISSWINNKSWILLNWRLRHVPSIPDKLFLYFSTQPYFSFLLTQFPHQFKFIQIFKFHNSDDDFDFVFDKLQRRLKEERRKGMENWREREEEDRLGNEKKGELFIRFSVAFCFSFFFCVENKKKVKVDSDFVFTKVKEQEGKKIAMSLFFYWQQHDKLLIQIFNKYYSQFSSGFWKEKFS
jgi:hypothetical protein